MIIVDANNLAGKLRLLKENDFDEKLIGMIKRYNVRQRKIFLVFDSLDVMGDKLIEGKLTVIYTPRDSFYKNADDKIVELIREAQYNPIKEEVIVITDDMEIKRKAEELKARIKNAADFAKELLEVLEQVEITDEKNELEEEEMDKITEELLRKWK